MFVFDDQFLWYILVYTCHGLQKLITACEQYGRLWDLKFNSLKSGGNFWQQMPN